jgi:hypothetical protein
MLLCKCKYYDPTPKTLCQLFNAFVSPILNYSFELWVNSKFKEVERIYLKILYDVIKVVNRWWWWFW